MKYILLSLALLTATDSFAKSRHEPAPEDIGVLLDYARLAAIYEKCAPRDPLGNVNALTTSFKFKEASEKWPKETYQNVRLAADADKADVQIHYRCKRWESDVDELRIRLGLGASPYSEKRRREEQKKLDALKRMGGDR